MMTTVREGKKELGQQETWMNNDLAAARKGHGFQSKVHEPVKRMDQGEAGKNRARHLDHAKQVQHDEQPEKPWKQGMQSKMGLLVVRDSLEFRQDPG